MEVVASQVPDWLNVSRETEDRLLKFRALVLKWNGAINLISKASTDQIWSRHILDSAQLFGLSPAAALRWADLGSGGGFPGIVIAILAAERQPALQVLLVESDHRKAVFLQEAVRHLGLTATVINQRIESLEKLSVDVLSARALAPLAVLCGYAGDHLNQGGTALFLKGANHIAEIDAARKYWSFDLEIRTSLTDPKAAILAMKAIRHV